MGILLTISLNLSLITRSNVVRKSEWARQASLAHMKIELYFIIKVESSLAQYKVLPVTADSWTIADLNHQGAIAIRFS